MDYTVKKLSKDDVKIASELFTWYQQDDGREVTIPSDGYLGNLLSGEFFHVYAAIKKGVVIGGLTAFELPMYKEQTTEMFLFEIAVHKDHRQKGVATQLITALKDTCLERNIRMIFVATSSDNEAAKRLYKTTGGKMEIIPWFTYHLDKNNDLINRG